MDVALSKNGARVLRLFFVLVVLFLYAPIAVLLVFSFNDSPVPAFPLSGFTFHWYPRQEVHLHCSRFEFGASARWATRALR